MSNENLFNESKALVAENEQRKKDAKIEQERMFAELLQKINNIKAQIILVKQSLDQVQFITPEKDILDQFLQFNQKGLRALKQQRQAMLDAIGELNEFLKPFSVYLDPSKTEDLTENDFEFDNFEYLGEAFYRVQSGVYKCKARGLRFTAENENTSDECVVENPQGKCLVLSTRCLQDDLNQYRSVVFEGWQAEPRKDIRGIINRLRQVFLKYLDY